MDWKDNVLESRSMNLCGGFEDRESVEVYRTLLLVGISRTRHAGP